MPNATRLDRLIAPRQDPRRDRYARVAAGVALLDTAARVDGRADPLERAASDRALEGLFDLDVRVLREVAHVVSGEALPDALRRVRDTWSTLRKHELLDAVREVVWADGELQQAEARLIAWLVSMLDLPLAEARRAMTRPEAVA